MFCDAYDHRIVLRDNIQSISPSESNDNREETVSKNEKEFLGIVCVVSALILIGIAIFILNEIKKVNNMKKKSRKKAILLSFLLGFIGGQKLYINSFFKFLLSAWFCFTGIPFLVGLYDGFRFLNMSDFDFDYAFNQDFLKIEHEKEKKQKEEEEELKRKQKEEEEKKKEEEILSLYGEEVLGKIKRKEFWLEMNQKQLIYIKGIPTEKEKHISKKGEKLVLIYGNKKSGDYFIFLNDSLIEYKDR